jgi:N-acetyl-anhydromuramyl-L-alanine amidase AmpD
MREIRFIQARNFTETGSAGRNIDLIVMHVMVAPETSDRAEACAQMFATTDRDASAHYNVDNNSIVQGVRDEDVAWAAPGANSDGIQIEQAGTIQTEAQWRDNYSSDMMKLAAELVAHLCKKHGIPAVWRDATDLKANLRGITDHWQATQAFRLSTHTDCGAAYPRNKLIQDVQDQLEGDHNKHARPDKPDLPTIKLGYHGWLAKKLQKHLKANGFYIGHERCFAFDELTEREVRRFQRHVGLRADGVVGPMTWRAVRR